MVTVIIATAMLWLKMNNGDFQRTPPSVPSVSEHSKGRVWESEWEIIEDSRALGVLNIAVLVTAGETQTLSQSIIALTPVCQVKSSPL